MNFKERKPNRLKNYDYSQNGLYFVTICTKNRINHFGEIENGDMILNDMGQIIKQQWLWLSEQYKYVFLDEYAVMPNHFHGILMIMNDVGNARERSALNRNGLDRSLQKIKSLSSLLGAFKTTSSKLIHQDGNKDFSWQKSFHDHIIRNEKSHENIREYIHYNPLKWEYDIENKLNKNPDINYYTKLFK